MLTDKYNSLCGIELHGLYTRVNITSMEYEASEVLTGGISRQLPCNRVVGEPIPGVGALTSKFGDAHVNPGPAFPFMSESKRQDN